MGEQDRLSALQVRIPGHPAVQVLFRASEQRSLDVGDAVIHVAEDVAEIEPLVQRDLVVAGAARMELAAHRARQLDEPPLDVHVDVFELLPEGERAAFELGADGLQPREQGRELVLADELRPAERPGPRRAAFEVIGPEAAIEGE